MRTSSRALLSLVLLMSAESISMASEKVFYYHNDHLGTPQAMTNDNRTVVWKAEYRPFGEATANEDPDGDEVPTRNNLRFPGQYYDAETGLHYNWHRYYEPETGRYLQPDPIGLAGGINPYEYAANNPVRFVDILGLAPGQEFTSAEAAAIDAIDYSRPLTDSKKVEHCGWILKKHCGGQDTYCYNEPTPGVSYECPLGWPPADSAKVWYHTHVKGQDLPFWVWRDPEKFSPEDAGVSFRTKSTGYLGAPSGHILRMPGTITRSDWESKVERVR